MIYSHISCTVVSEFGQTALFSGWMLLTFKYKVHYKLGVLRGTQARAFKGPGYAPPKKGFLQIFFYS